MKKIITLFIVAFIAMATIPAFSQTYKTAADTTALNIEYAKVSSDIANLTVSLDKAKNQQAEDAKKSADATADAQSTASKTSDKASQSTGESVKDAKQAKREARRSVKDAKDARHQQNNLDDANKKIQKLNDDLQKKAGQAEGTGYYAVFYRNTSIVLISISLSKVIR